MKMWILKLMQLLVAHAPWDATFPDTAAAIDEIAHEAPLYEGDDGAVRTAADLVALTYYESKFDPRAVGGEGTSLGLAQIHVSNLHDLGLSREELFDARSNLRAAVELMKLSHRKCRSRPLAERLANYASGGPGCDVPAGLDASRRRMKLAADLLRKHPPVWTEAPESPQVKPSHERSPRPGGPRVTAAATRRERAPRKRATPRPPSWPRASPKCSPPRVIPSPSAPP